MTTIQLIACVGMIAGLFMVLGISPAEMSDSIFSRLTAAPGSIRADINETTKRKRPVSFAGRSQKPRRYWPHPGGRENSPWCAWHLWCCLPWAPASPFLPGTPSSSPVLAVGFMLMPFWYVADGRRLQKDVAAELETALSVITTAYLRTENFQQAVEENIRYLTTRCRRCSSGFHPHQAH